MDGNKEVRLCGSTMWSAVRNVVAIFFLVSCVLVNTAVASLVVQTPPSGIDDGKLSTQLASMAQFDARDWTMEGKTRCNEEPLFPVNQQTVVRVQTTSGERHFVLYIPASYPRRRSSKAALKLLFHGLNDRCDRFLNVSGFIEHADSDGYILASLCGSPGLIGTAWNSGTCCGFLSPDTPDDFGFVEKVVQTVMAGACVDPAKVMAVGFSNGAMMAEVLGCLKPKVFRAVASVGGIVELRPGNEGALEACGRAIRTDNAEGRRPSVLMVHGDLDAMVPLGGNKLLGFPSVQDNVANWVNLNGCDERVDVTINTIKYTNQVYAKCDSPATASESRMRTYLRRAKRALKERFTGQNIASLHESIVEIVHAHQGGHSWPEDDEFSTTDYIYEFGKRVFSSY